MAGGVPPSGKTTRLRFQDQNCTVGDRTASLIAHGIRSSLCSYLTCSQMIKLACGDYSGADKGNLRIFNRPTCFHPLPRDPPAKISIRVLLLAELLSIIFLQHNKWFVSARSPVARLCSLHATSCLDYGTMLPVYPSPAGA